MNTTHKIIFALTVLSIFPFSLIQSQPQQYKFEKMATGQGLSSNKVYSIIEDSQGFIWLSTGLGLFRYDGNNFRSYGSYMSTSSTSFGYLITSHLFIDASGNLWIGTKNNGLNLFNCKTESVIQFRHDANNPKSLSHNNVQLVFQDEDGVIWVGTLGGGLNMLIHSDQSFVSFTPDPDSSECAANSIHSIISYDNKHLMVGTNLGPRLFNKESKRFIKWKNHMVLTRSLQQDIIVDIIREDTIFWFATENGLVRYDSLNKQVTRYLSVENKKSTLSSNTIRHMIESRDKKELWISTAWGLNRFNKETTDNTQFLYDKNNPNSLGYNMLWHLYLDNCDKLWIGTDNAGVNILDLNDSPFSHYRVGDIAPYENQYTATDFCEDENNNLWIGTFDGGLWKYDPVKKIIQKFLNGGDNSDPFYGGSIFSLFSDSENTVWVGTSNGMLHKVKKSECESYQIQTDEAFQRKASILEIIKDQSGTLWLGTTSGLLYADEAPDNFNIIENEFLQTALIRAIREDTYGTLWIGTDGEGLFKINRNARGDIQVKKYMHEPELTGTIGSNTVMSIYEDSSGRLWIATIQGLYKYLPKQDSFASYGIYSGQGTEYLYHIQGDQNGFLWLTSSNGLIRFDPASGSSKLYEFQRDVSLEDIYPFSFYLNHAGKIYVGGKYGNARGFYILDPDKLTDNMHIPPVVLTDFKVRNETYKSDSVINFKRVLKLQYNQNYFSFEFAALDYTNPSKNQYAYLLDGYDEDWIYSGNRRFANYTGVPPGHYIFRVKGSNNDGFWNEEGASIAVTILKPPWRSWWANALYVIFIVGIITSIAWYYLKRQELRRELFVEHMQKEKLEEMDRMKSRFFANISHEFRTPLTLILGPIKKLKAISTHSEMLEDLDIMQRNANRLQRLIDQLLSLSKIEAGQMKLQAGKGNIVEFVKGYLGSFESAAERKGIKIYFKTSRLDIPLYFDRDKLEKILYNLFANAIKFTGEGGLINVAIASHESLITITVSDTGKGISPEHLPHIFDRFYQADNFDTQFHEGSGIGLSLVKELVELHHGQITVESKPGKGTTFIISLPAGTAHLREEELAEAIETPEANVSDEKNIEIPSTDPELAKPAEGCHSSRKKPLLLLVEDNADMRKYIRGIIEGPYLLAESDNGSQGLEFAIGHIPDMVISDVMMPGMDGYELCRQLKNDYRTSHIPVILLTAKASVEDRLEGLQTGADDFLIKPFEPMELLARIKNLIQQRQALRERYRREFEHVRLKPEASMDALEIEFMEKARKVVGENISNPDFHISDFSGLMNMSRVQLHRKLIALFNLSATAFIRTYRLNEAARLFNSRLGNVAEVAYEVGFNNLSYFSKCFQKQFGVNPSEYLNQPHPEPEKKDTL